MTLPRLVIAAPASGHGKTTVASGIMAALRRRGHVVSGHKVGPDYIDPGYHALATGRPGRNLDPQLVGEERLIPLLLHGSRGADVAIIEGVMGLYDGAIGQRGYASTAHVARLVDAPVLLVIDIGHASRSVAAVVHGMATFDPQVRIGGVILNKSGSARHAAEVRDALGERGFPVLGTLPRDPGISAPSRHLGLVPVAEQQAAATALDRLAAQVAKHIDLDAVLSLARETAPLVGAAWDATTALVEGGLAEGGLGEARSAGAAADSAKAPVVAVAAGRAFTFRYTETDELLRAAGCTVVEVDPLTDQTLPPGTRGLYLGGGFPEAHVSELSANLPLRQEIRAAIAGGLPTVAECAGMLYLCESLDDVPMVGALRATARMTSRLTLAYRTAQPDAGSLAGSDHVAGHEFHRTALDQPAGPTPAWVLDGRTPEGFALDPAGRGAPTVHASYLHTHWAGTPRAAVRFVEAVRRTAPYAAPPPSDSSTPVPAPRVQVTTLPGGAKGGDLHSRRGAQAWHHGDVEATQGLVDFAVNVQHAARPPWLDDALVEALLDRRYPSPDQATDAVAAQHRRPTEQVLPTSGAAEAFTLLARARAWQAPAVIHPQFSEPDRALHAAGLHPEQVILAPERDFDLDPALVPQRCDLVFVGNPTNPTGRLHPAALIRALQRPGRVVVVDEAFLDAVPDEPESLGSVQDSGLVVIRSLTKTWSIPGIRAGYLLGDATVLRACADQQPSWSVSGPALAALVACSTSEALAEARRRAVRVVADRDHLQTGLAALGVRVQPGSAAPFVLAQVGSGVRESLRRNGIAVRRGDTFPGLDDSWVRIAVRDPRMSDLLLEALVAARIDIGQGVRT